MVCGFWGIPDPGAEVARDMPVTTCQVVRESVVTWCRSAATVDATPCHQTLATRSLVIQQENRALPRAGSRHLVPPMPSVYFARFDRARAPAPHPHRPQPPSPATPRPPHSPLPPLA